MKKKAKKTAILSSLILCLTLTGATAWILLTPITAYAAECSADCGVGGTVHCSGSGACYAQDGWGCKAQNGNGRPPMIQLCPVY